MLYFALSPQSGASGGLHFSSSSPDMTPQGSPGVLLGVECGMKTIPIPARRDMDDVTTPQANLCDLCMEKSVTKTQS